MQPPKSNGQSRFSEFLAECGGLGYVAVFKPLLESMMKDPHLPAISKVLAWLKYYAWGNHTAVPVRYPGDLPLTQQDCAQEVGTSPQMVSNAFRQLERDGYILRKGPFFALNPNPKLPEQPPTSRKSAATNPAFEAHFAITHGAAIKAALQAQETLKNFRLLKLNEQKLWAKTHRVESSAPVVESSAPVVESSAPVVATAKNGVSNPVLLDRESGAPGFSQAPILICDKKEKEERRAAAAKVPTTEPPPDFSKPANTSPPVQVPPAEITVNEQEVIDACAPITARLGLSLTPGMLGLILQNLKNAPASWLAERIKTRGKYANSLGILSQLATDAYEQYVKDSANGHKKPASRTVDPLGDKDFVPLWDTNGKGAAS